MAKKSWKRKQPSKSVAPKAAPQVAPQPAPEVAPPPEEIITIQAPGYIQEYFKRLRGSVDTATMNRDRSNLKEQEVPFTKLITSIGSYLFSSYMFGTFSLFGDVGARKEAAKRIKETILILIGNTTLYPLTSSLGYAGAAKAMDFIRRVSDLGSYYVVLKDKKLFEFLGVPSETNFWGKMDTFVGTEMDRRNIELTEGLARRTALAILVARAARRHMTSALVKAVNKNLAAKLVDD